MKDENNSELFFITVCGKKVKHGDLVYVYSDLHSDYNRVYPMYLSFNGFGYTNTKAFYEHFFLTEQECIDHVVKNSRYNRKVVFTTKDNVGIKRYDKYFRINIYEQPLKIKEEVLTEPCETCLCQVKCGKDKAYIYFSTYETSQKYIEDKNNP